MTGEFCVFLKYKLLYAVVVDLQDVFGIQFSDIYEELLPILWSEQFIQILHIFTLVNPVIDAYKFEDLSGLFSPQYSFFDLEGSFLMLLAKQRRQPQIHLGRKSLFDSSRSKFPRSCGENDLRLADFGG